jgi:hypothetical protein
MDTLIGWLVATQVAASHLFALVGWVGGLVGVGIVGGVCYLAGFLPRSPK